jgi:hypothetical protein
MKFDLATLQGFLNSKYASAILGLGAQVIAARNCLITKPNA